ncbi:anti-sigma factor family protein [Anatilimnocola floriformis]|uniref:anti-sigma factor family protein n=1 Tax=Anatilimnocola floriformis TaxID=2948575 RepID=UPI0020C2F94C|nr:zf-HC2 domain-containing protein [Anatilimnocola floriformis]
MKCTDFEDRLNDILDERRSPHTDAALTSHAATCADCRELLADHESLFRGLAVLSHRTASSLQETLSPELGTRVLSEYNTPVIVPPLPPAPRRSWFPLVATAAAVLIVVGIGVLIANRGGRQPIARDPAPRNKGNGNGLAIANPNRATIPAESPKKAPPAIVVHPERLPPRTPPTAEEAEALRQMASIATWSNTAQWPQVDTLNVGQVEQYAPGIRPIRESFEVALDALLRTIPSGKKDTRNTPPQAIQPYGEMLDLA